MEACEEVATGEYRFAQAQRCVRGSFVASLLAPIIDCIPMELLIKAVVFT